jgi:HK97 family phage major capsid protein
MDIKQVLGRGDRLLKPDGDQVDRMADRIEFSVCSEYPVREFYGDEILSHERSAVKLDRVPGMPFLWNHGKGELGKRPLGVVERWTLDGNKSRVMVRWTKEEYAQPYRRQYEDDILTCFSVGFQKHQAREIGSSPDGSPRILVTAWEPIEVSLVPDPADPTVGKYRSLREEDEEEDETPIAEVEAEEETEDEEAEETPMENSKKPMAYKSMMESKPSPERGGIMEQINMDEIRAAETERQRSIRAMGDQWSRNLGPQFAQLAEELIEGGKSVEEARSVFSVEVERGFSQQPLAGMSNPTEKPRDYLPGFGKRENQQYSMLRLLRSMIPDFPNDYGKNCFEREVSQEIARKVGGSEDRVYFPTRNLSYGQRDIQNTGSAALGGNLIDTDLRADMWIEALRNKAMALQMGAKFVTGLRGNVAFPKESGVIAAEWVNENDPAPESNYTVSQISLTPKQIAAYTTLTRTLLLQSTPDAEMIARDNLVKAMALKIDETVLYGSGIAPVPKGLANYAGIKTIASGFGADGGYPTYEKLIELCGEIEAANANINGLKWLINAKTQARLMITPVQSSGVEGNFIIKDGASTFCGKPYYVSNQVRSNLTKGNGTGLSEIYLGDWSQIYIGEWEGLSLSANYNGATFRTGGVEIVAFQTMDINVSYEESFGLFTDAKTAS